MFDHAFPLVVCSVHPHPEPRPGWIVCTHIARDVRTPIGYLESPTREELGQLLCPECRQRWPLDRLRLACPDCVADIMRARELKP